jgi:hypothetical protein
MAQDGVEMARAFGRCTECADSIKGGEFLSNLRDC